MSRSRRPRPTNGGGRRRAAPASGGGRRPRSSGGSNGATGAILAGSLLVLVAVILVIVSMSSSEEVTAGEDFQRSKSSRSEPDASEIDPDSAYEPPMAPPLEPPREQWEVAQQHWKEGERLLDKMRVARDSGTQDEFDRLRREASEKMRMATDEAQRYLNWFNERLDFDDSPHYDPKRYASYRSEHRRTEKMVQKWIRLSNEARH
ncbi:MAG: hypothetical protein RL885_06445 [Planctomycetota bacterium]